MTFEGAEVRILRSDRKSYGLGVNAEGITVRAPKKATDRDVERILEEHRRWVRQKLELVRQRLPEPPADRLTMAELQALAQQALEVIPRQVRYYAPLVGVTYGRITIRNQRTRWGSCSSKGNLNFNCLLMLAPPEVIDSVVVHELCHRKEMNHSKAFYDEVYRVFPDYDRWNEWLKKNGPGLMARMPK